MTDRALAEHREHRWSEEQQMLMHTKLADKSRMSRIKARRGSTLGELHAALPSVQPEPVPYHFNHSASHVQEAKAAQHRGSFRLKQEREAHEKKRRADEFAKIPASFGKTAMVPQPIRASAKQEVQREALIRQLDSEHLADVKTKGRGWNIVGSHPLGQSSSERRGTNGPSSLRAGPSPTARSMLRSTLAV